jgi:hypothetical protein
MILLYSFISEGLWSLLRGITIFPESIDITALLSPTLALEHISPTINITIAHEPDLSIIIF